jgi:hypothetical protein
VLLGLSDLDELLQMRNRFSKLLSGFREGFAAVETAVSLDRSGVAAISLHPNGNISGDAVSADVSIKINCVLPNMSVKPIPISFTKL